MPGEQANKPVRSRGEKELAPPDLQTQLEALLDQVWRSEAEWRLWDRIDAFCASQPGGCLEKQPAARLDTRWSR